MSGGYPAGVTDGDFDLESAPERLTCPECGAATYDALDWEAAAGCPECVTTKEQHSEND